MLNTVYVGSAFIATMLVSLISISPVLLTKKFAYEPFQQDFLVTDLECLSERGFRSTITIHFSEELAIGQRSIDFHDNVCRKDPAIRNLKGKIITLYGRSWFLGSYVDKVKYPIT